MLVIDPYLFYNEDDQYSNERIIEIKTQLNEIISICRKCNSKVIFDRKGWKNIELTIIRRITDGCRDSELGVALTVLRRNFLQLVDVDVTERIRTWGIKPLFNGLSTKIDLDFAESVTRSLSHCFQNYQRVLFFVREIENRNIKTHASDRSFICERTRWRIYFSKRGLHGIIPVSCITRMRNISLEWTTRYDAGLPDTGKYAFQPVVDWHRRDTEVVGVMQAKPVFFDVMKNGWAKPNTPGLGYHWDVYLTDRHWINASGLDQINVCRSDIPPSQGSPGEIHHVPTGKASRARM